MRKQCMNEYSKESSRKRVRKRQMVVTETHIVTGALVKMKIENKK